MSWGSSWGYAPYVSVAKRKEKAATLVAKLKKKGEDIRPIVVDGRVIAKTFWGKAWCKHLETYSDYENRLPRGRTYIRNGSVIDLKLKPGKITALVSGSSIYTVDIEIDPIPSSKWEVLTKECAGKIESLIELLQGKFSKGVMEIITHSERGLFPDPKEIKLSCSCYDWADMCKHVAAVLYGIGARLDEQPEDIFILRHVDHRELLAQAGSLPLSENKSVQDAKIVTGDLSALFGIDIEDAPQNINNKEKGLPQRENQLKASSSKRKGLKKRKDKEVPTNKELSKRGKSTKKEKTKG